MPFLGFGHLLVLTNKPQNVRSYKNMFITSSQSLLSCAAPLRFHARQEKGELAISLTTAN